MCSKTSIMQDQDVLPLLIDRLPEFVVKKCREELNESPERKLKALEELRLLLQKSENTSGINFHEDFLVQFLRRNKYRIQDSFHHLHSFIVLNKKENDLFKSIPDHYLDTISSKYVVLLPKRCPDGCVIILLRIAKWNPEELPFQFFKKMAMMVYIQLLRDPMNQINGIKTIYDFQGSLAYLKYCTPQNIYLFYNVALKCLPGRWKEIHLINQSIFLKTAWNILKHFLTQKIKNRVYFHSDTNELFKYFRRSIIPIEYGGTLQDPGMEDWIRKANKEHEEYSIEGQPNFYSS